MDELDEDELFTVCLDDDGAPPIRGTGHQRWMNSDEDELFTVCLADDDRARRFLQAHIPPRAAAQ